MKISIAILTLVACASAWADEQKIDLAPVKKRHHHAHRGGGAQDLLGNTKVMRTSGPDEATREGAMRQTMETQRLEGSLPNGGTAPVVVPNAGR